MESFLFYKKHKEYERSHRYETLHKDLLKPLKTAFLNIQNYITVSLVFIYNNLP